MTVALGALTSVHHKTTIKDPGLCELLGSVDRLNGALLEFYRLATIFYRKVHELFGYSDAPIMVNANLRNNKCRLSGADDAVSYFDFRHIRYKPRVIPFSYFNKTQDLQDEVREAAIKSDADASEVLDVVLNDGTHKLPD